MFVPYGQQSISQADIDAVVSVMQSDFLTQGPKVPEFESVIANFCEAKYASAVNSATSALHLACLSLGLGQGDWLWTTPISFVASANCGLYCGAKVDFVDIDSETYNLSIPKLEHRLIQAKLDGRLPKVLVAVHLAGQSCDMESIARLSHEYGFSVIEDASHAIGGRYQGKPVGCCEYSDLTIFSFHPVKIVTTAEGGVVVTNSAELDGKVKLLRSHGVTRDQDLMTREPDGAWYYQQVDLGFNYRMTELQAALGISQMKSLESFVTRRHQLAHRYNQRLSGLPIKLPNQHIDSYSGMHLYIIRLKLSYISKTHQQVFEELRSEGIGVNLHYIPIHTQPYYQNMGFKYGDFPEAEEYYREAISIPLFHGMSDEQQEYVIEALYKVLG